MTDRPVPQNDLDVLVIDAGLFRKGNSRHLSANVPGQPRTFSLSLGVHRQICTDVAAEGYRGFDLS